MALAYNWDAFIRNHGDYPGARHMFEVLMDELLRAENPDKEIHIIKAVQGDGGIDICVHEQDGIEVYQCKFYMGSMTSSRWSEIKHSFMRAMEDKGVPVIRWYLCVPREMQKEDLEGRKEFITENGRFNIPIRFIDGNEIIQRMRECDRLKGTDLIYRYFHDISRESELLHASKSNTAGNLLKNLYDKLNFCLENERKNHPSFKLMNEAFGFDRKLVPRGSLQIPVSSRMVSLECDTENKEDKEAEIATLAEYVKKSRQFDERKHITIDGEGGIGKTVALLSLTLEPGIFSGKTLVIYIPLKELNRKKYAPREGRSRLDWFIESYLKYKSGCTAAEIKFFYDLCDHQERDQPQVILLLDGYNEVLDTIKSEVKIDINEWGNKEGIQIITTSRTAWSCGERFLRVRLHPLDKSTITGFLERIGAEVPVPDDNLWRVIDYPLMLTLYTHISAVQKQATDDGLSADNVGITLNSRDIIWHTMNKAGDIIWNYLQKELVRCVKTVEDLRDIAMEDYAVALLHSAPYIAWRMSRSDSFFLPLEETDEEVTGRKESFTRLVSESITCLKDENGWPNQLKRIIGSQRMKRWKKPACAPESDERFDKAERIVEILLNESVLFKVWKNGDADNMKPVKMVEMMHQQFRDGLAAVWLCQKIETMEMPFDAGEGIHKSTGDRYALPLCWREKIGRYVLKFAADILNEREASLFWEAGRVFQPSNVRFAYTMLNLMSERSVKNGICENDFRDLDFSGMNLREISLSNYKKEGTKKLYLPNRIDPGKMKGTGISRLTFEPQGHKGAIRSVSLNDDGKRVVSGGDDGVVRVWDLESMTCEKQLEGHIGWVYSVSVSADGKWAVSGGDDGTIRLWNLESMIWEKVLDEHGDSVESISLSDNGKRAVSGGDDGTVRSWDFENMTCEKVLERQERILTFARCVSVSGDGKRAMTGETDGTVRVWNLESMTCEKELNGHKDWVHSVSLSSDGKRAVSGGADGMVRVWNLESMACEKELNGHKDCVHSVSLSSDGKRAVSGDEAVRVWDLSSMSCEKVLEGHSNVIRSVSVSGDGRRAASGDMDGSLRVWDLEGMMCEKVLEGYSDLIESISLSTDGKRAVSGGAYGILRVWDLENMVCERLLEGSHKWVYSVSVSGDGKRAVSGGDNGTLCVWNLESMRCEKVLERRHKRFINHVSLSDDGKQAVSIDSDETICVWDLESMTCKLASDDRRSIDAVSNEGKRAVSIGEHGVLRVLNHENATHEQVLENWPTWAMCVSMSGDGKRALSGGDDGTISVWNLENLTCEKVLEGHKGFVSSVSLSDDGKLAVSRGGDNKVRVWDLENMTCKQVLFTNIDERVSVDGNDKRAVSCRDNGLLHVWDLESMVCEKTLILLPGIDIVGIDLSESDIDTERTREILRENGALVS